MLIVLLALGAALAAPVGAQPPSGEQWLAAAVAALPRVSFTGTKVVMAWTDRGAEASTVVTARRAPNGLRLEYPPTASRKRRIVIDDGHRRWQYEPGAKLALLSPSALAGDGVLSGDHLPLLLANYTAAVVGEERVAGRPAVVIAVRPRTSDRVALRIWLDRETFLVLRSEGYHADGRMAQAAAFTEIRYQEPPAQLFAFTPPPGVEVRRLPWNPPVAIHDLARRVRFHPIAPPRLAGGFVLDRAFLSRSHAVPVAVLHYTDGLVTLSFFQQKGVEGARRSLDRGKPIAVAEGMGSVRQVGGLTMLQWRARGLDLTLAGDLSPAELVSIASTIGVDAPPGVVARLTFWAKALLQRLEADL
ncbi:MAG: sigma-E factor regulatory protein RseB domain-containing protein [Armatimonadota bacterium]|nr:sigma-E factor regulatory protein RseB domain-containing protein [Armatimonadota bacterium]MDR7535120.1 sigma-E factor regulatory protein RseB domain-containing protein [Armatimonadota bacterium]